MISIEVDTKPDSDWNKRLLQSGFGSVYQSQERAALLEMENVSNNFLKFNRLLINKISRKSLYDIHKAREI